MIEQNNLHINNYDGPFDLLLTLVKDKKMDIFSIDISELATAYLAIMSELKDDDIDLASEYLVMAATLLQLKAKLLLEDPNEEKEVQEEKMDLLSQLAEYQQFKMVAEKLREREIKRRDIHIKETSDYFPYQKEQDETQLDGNSNAVKLIEVMRRMFERTNATKLKEVTIEKFDLSPAERREEIILLFKDKNERTFEDIFSVPTMNHFVLTMLTILDMARKQELILEQDEQYSTMRIRKGVMDE